MANLAPARPGAVSRARRSVAGLAAVVNPKMAR
jgi:hypothetical protein